MKVHLIVILLLLSLKGFAQYSVSFQTSEGQTKNLTDYTGKKLLIVISDAASPDARQLMILDSFYQANDSILSMVVVPIDDFDTPLDSSTLSILLRDSLNLHCTIGQTCKGGKANESEQQELLQWLTHKNDNAHFDDDITRDGQMYLLNETGTLIGKFEKFTTLSLLSQVVKQTITE